MLTLCVSVLLYAEFNLGGNEMIRAYFFVAVLAAMLYPIAWFVILTPASFNIVYGYSIALAVIATIGMVSGAMLGLFTTRALATRVPEILRGFFIRFIGSEIAGLIAFSFIWTYMMWEESRWQPFGLGVWLLMSVPGAVSAYIAYWLVSFLITPVAPLPKRKH